MSNSKNKTVLIHYQKNPMYRSVHADGAVGGLTPADKVQLSFFATRKIIPKSVEYTLNENGKIDKLVNISPDSKIGVMREVEVCVYMDRKVAENLYKYLEQILKINDLK